MKKRLRKKKRLGEFREMGFAVAIKWTSPTMDWALIGAVLIRTLDTSAENE